MRVSFLTRSLTVMLLTCAMVCWQADSLYPAQAKKKKEDNGAAEAAAAEAAAAEALKKDLEPLNKDITALMTKAQSRTLMSPEDASKLGAIQFKLADMINANPGAPELASPVYQAGLLFNQREDFFNAYELFSFLSSAFPQTPYGMKARVQILQMEKRLGADYFPKELSQSLSVAKPSEPATVAPEPAPAKK